MIESGVVAFDTSKMSRDEWLECRREGIGGSDVAAISGLSSFKSPLEVYLEKKRLIPDREDNARMEAGRRLERFIAEWFAEVTGKTVKEDPFMYRHPEYEFMFANIDGWIEGENAGLEIKNVGEYSRSHWFDGGSETVPEEYLLQVNHYMCVTGAERWYVAALIGGWDLQWRIVERDESLIKSLINIEYDFWHNNVMAGVEPLPSHHDTDVMSSLYPASREKHTIDLGNEHYKLVHELIQSKDDLKQAEERHEEAKNQIKRVMEDRETAYWQETKLCTWKSTTKGYRVFRITGGL